MNSYYGTLTEADEYFSKRLNSDVWENAVINDREKSLYMATAAIDKLNFAGFKATDTQELQFPRVGDTVVPQEIEYACYECALAFLDGVNLEQEAQTIGVLTESYTGVRTAYDESHLNEHLRAGIPTIDAWSYLKPFLRDAQQIIFNRIS